MIARYVLGLALACAACSLAGAQDQKRIEELKRLIAEKKAEAAKLEAELAKLEPPSAREQAEIPAAARKKMIDAYPRRPEFQKEDKGEIGYIETNHLTTVGKIIDERQVVLIFRQVAGKEVVKSHVLFVGIDTSKLTDGQAYIFKGVVYFAGNGKVNLGPVLGETTIRRLIVFQFTPEEMAALKK